MALIRRGKVWHIRFQFEGREHKFSSKTSDEKLAREIEQRKKLELIEGFHGLESRTKYRTKLLKDALGDYLQSYKLDHEGKWDFLQHRIRRLNEFFGARTIGQVSLKDVRDYQAHRRAQGAAIATVNMEVGVLCRGMEERGDQLRLELKRKKMLRLKGKPTVVGQPYTVEEQDRLLEFAEKSGSPHLPLGLKIALNTGMRHSEIAGLRWAQIDFTKNRLIVGDSKSEASTGREVPLNAVLRPAFEKHQQWFEDTFGEIESSWYLFPGGHLSRMNPAKHINSFEEGWNKLRERAGLSDRRFHDMRHSVITELVENDVSPETIRQL